MNTQEQRFRPDYLHHKNTDAAIIREAVFGFEDGMVSTLGAITGIATGVQNPSIVMLSGFIIIAVESISMGVGSYLSNKSEKEIESRMLNEEREEIENYPEEEIQELGGMYHTSGWPKKLAYQMANAAAKKPKLMLQEMAYRELNIIPEKTKSPRKNGLIMGLSYIIGGFIPLTAYFVLPIFQALIVSVLITLAGLFLLGVGTARFTKRLWWKSGLEMLTLAAIAAVAGYIIGWTGNRYILSK